MNKFVKNLIIILITIISIFTAVHFALAVDLGTDYATNLGLGEEDPRVIAVNIVRIALTFIGIIAICIIIYAGFLWMTAAGSPEKIDKAKKTLIGAVIGLIIILSAWAIVTFIINRMSEVVTTGPVCTPECVAPAPKCCPGNFCCDATDSCCGPACCPAGFCCCSSVCQDCPCNPPLAFIVTAIQPPEAICPIAENTTIRNSVIRIYFSKPVDQASVDASTIVIQSSNVQCPVGALAPVSGDFTVNGKVVEFRPVAGTCPINPCSADRCFGADSTIDINLPAGGVTTDGGSEGLAMAETSQFFTNDLIDCQDPIVSLNSDPQVCLGIINDLGSVSSDDSGVSQVEFSDSNGNAAFGGGPVVVPCPGPGVCGQSPADWTLALGSATWLPTAPAYSAGTNYAITATASDLDDNTDSNSQNFILRPAHCCNDTWDEVEEEEGVDCGGECAACSGAACGISFSETCAGDPDPNCDDNRCASGFCSCGNHPDGPLPDDSCQEKGYDAVVGDVCCVCENKPMIGWVTPMGGFCDDDINMPCQEDADCATACNTDTANGAIGNFVTIGGRNFGASATPGTVYFSDGAGGWTQAFLANDDLNGGNSACGGDVWKDNQIIVVVPAGAAEGPIRVEEAVNNYTDDTDDAYGNPINDFVVNTIERPGLCQLNPDNGVMNDAIAYDGIRLSVGSSINFGDFIAGYVEALNFNFINDKNVQADVPNIETGRTTSFAINNVLGIDITSNYWNFTKNPEAVSGPYITSFEPTQGSEGQYVTIYGSGFGNSKGASAVHFGDELGPQANYDFPDVCADSVWGDNQVIIKVPTVADGNYIITMVIGGSDIINTDPGQFTVNSSLPLAPSLCKIQPIMGPNNSPVSLWGEYFGSEATGLVRFHLNHDQSGAAITFWGAEDDADKAETTVHQDAVSGPVRIVQAGLEGNGMNFTIGLCTEAPDPDAACGTDICCPVGSYEEGRCHATIDDCYITVTSSVYEWDFSTAGPTAPGDPCYVDLATTPFCSPTFPDCTAPQVCDPATCTCQLPYAESCMGYGQGECADNLCPNSPGNCSPYAGGGTVIAGDCDDAECVSRFGAGYSYKIALNKCVDGVACDLSRIVLDGIGDPITAYCADYEGAGRWHIDTSVSCPTGWSGIGGNQCIEDATTCNYCDSGLSCLDDSGSGICAVDQEICPISSSCVAGQCEKLDSAVCECCCRDPGTGLYDAEDCCVPLICEGECGTDRIADNNEFGYCSGCALAGTTQAEHDAACNCFHTSGKFCDTSDIDYPEGVCRDCAQLSTTGECNLHNTTCCTDNKQGDACRGGDGTLLASGYCAYYDCQVPPNEDLCATANPVMNAAYGDISSCEAGCGAGTPPLPGLSCYDLDTGFCEIVCGTGYDCLGDTGCFDNDAMDPRGACPGGDMTCLCCCDPEPIYDKCSDINPVLTCTPDTDPCDGNERGLCCGCTQDDDCGDPNAIGCGFDGCCRSRPEVIERYPLDEDDAEYAPVVCRNTIIKATFDQEMDISSFTGKVIVVGDYGSGQCPEGTEFLVKEDAQNKGKLARILDKIKTFFKKIIKPISYLARAYTSPVPADHNYCAITGAVSGYNNAAGQGELIFSPNQLLDAGRKYYVIIKGDSNITDSISEGVLNYYDISMNGAHTETFNARTYANAYIWSFEVEGVGVGVAEDGLVGLWKFDEGSGNTAFDSSGNGNNGTLTNMDPATDWVDGEIGGALEFDGVDDYVDAGDYTGNVISTLSGPISVSLWFNWLGGGPTDYIISSGGQTAGAIGFACAFQPDDDLQCYGHNGSIFYHLNNILPDLVYGKWYHLNLIYNSTTFSVYIDGEFVKSTSGSDNSRTDSYTELHIGKPNNTNQHYFNGKIDEVAIYNRALSVGEIQALYSQSAGQVCELDYVSVDPPSYLFTTAGDTQTFMAQAKTAGGGDIASIAGIYNWSWDWTSDSTSVANVVMQAAPNEMFGDVTSQNVKDDKTYIRATATITEDEINNTVGQSKEGKAQVYVFLCENPWPPVDPLTGAWQPWIDSITNCSIPDAGCSDTRYDIYYCRDDGGAGTADDFPAILSGAGDTVIRGSSTAQNVLKELYYLREEAPVIAAAGLTAVNTPGAPTGGEVTADWPASPDAGDPNFAGYKLYWGTSSGNYDDHETGLDTHEVIGNAPGEILINNVTYYFTVTSYFTTGAESEFSNEVEIIVTDSVAPDAPTGLTAIAGDEQIDLNWTASVSTDTVGYKVYYGTTAGIYGDSQDVGDVSGAIVTGLTNGQRYYFAVTAYDDYDNESGYSGEVVSMPVLIPDGLVSYWSFNDGSGNTAFDYVGGRNGTLFGPPSWVDGKIGKGLEFNGAGYYIEAGTISLTDQDFTVSAWVKTNKMEKNIIGTITGGADDGFGLYSSYYSMGLPSFLIWDWPAQQQSLNADISSITDNQWHHIAGVREGTDLYIYIDGNLEGSDSSSVVSLPDNDPIVIGRMRDGQHEMNGIIDEVRVYNRALSDSEIQQLYEE